MARREDRYDPVMRRFTVGLVVALALVGTVREVRRAADGTVFLEGCSASDEPVDAAGSFFAVTSAGARRASDRRRPR